MTMEEKRAFVRSMRVPEVKAQYDCDLCWMEGRGARPATQAAGFFARPSEWFPVCEACAKELRAGDPLAHAALEQRAAREGESR